ncbi:hypothetical protein [Shigella flexneri]|nr:hypothetical protein [Shigella flexneri]
MAQARQVIGQLEHESSQHVPFANEMAVLTGRERFRDLAPAQGNHTGA